MDLEGDGKGTLHYKYYSSFFGSSWHLSQASIVHRGTDEFDM